MCCIVCSVSGVKLTNAVNGEVVSGSQQAEVSTAGGDKANDDVSGTAVVECDSFCDFIRFEGTVTEHVVSSAGSRLVDSGTGTLLRACIEKYKSFFEALGAVRILQHNRSLSASFMDRFVSPEACSDRSEVVTRSAGVRGVDRVELTGLTKGVVDAFSLACQLLVDFSALPVYSESALSSPTANTAGKNSRLQILCVSKNVPPSASTNVTCSCNCVFAAISGYNSETVQASAEVTIEHE